MKMIATLLLSFLTLTLMSQPPESFTYQAVARGSSGEILANENIVLRISILQNSPTGSAQYVETHNVETNNYGLININIGNGSVESGSFGSIAWDADDHFVKLEIDTESGGSSFEWLGTSQLLSVPYALMAGNVKDGAITSEKIDNGSVSSAKLSTDAVSNSKIRDAAVTTSKIDSAAITHEKIASNAVNDSNITNEPGLSHNNYTYYGKEISLNTDWQIIDSLVIDCPSPGYVVCLATGYIDYDDDTFTGSTKIGWDPNNDEWSPPSMIWATQPNPGANAHIPYTVSYTYTIIAAGENTFYLKAETTGTGDGTEIDAFVNNTNVMFFPTAY